MTRARSNLENGVLELPKKTLVSGWSCQLKNGSRTYSKVSDILMMNIMLDNVQDKF